MKIILEPLKVAGKEGVMMEGWNGEVRRVHPVLTCYVADYPEQCLVTCSKYGTCPKCQTAADNLGELKVPPNPLRTGPWTEGILAQGLENHGSDHHAFHKHCMSSDVMGGVYSPFWHGFPFTDIHRITTPDVLHQLYQGVLKHLISWAQQVVGKNELDARIRALPPMAGVRRFKNGISALSQISGSERKHMAKILLCAVADVMPAQGVKAVKAFLDFLYLAQYSTHDTDTLKYLRSALEKFHQHAPFFVAMGCRDHLNLPKLHSLQHYVESIELFGTTDNYNTEMFERLHIDFAKYGWRATNQRDEFPQMIRWLSRQEKMILLERDIDLRLTADSSNSGSEMGSDTDSTHSLPPPSANSLSKKPLGLSDHTTIVLSRRPQHPASPIDHIAQLHHAPHFRLHLTAYLKTFVVPGTRHEHLTLPFQELDVWSLFRLFPPALHDDASEQEVVRAERRSARNPAGRFDVVLVKESEEVADIFEVAGTRVGRVKVVFTLPSQIFFPGGVRDAPSVWPKEPLAYVEWFTRFSADPNTTTGMYKVSPAYDGRKRRQGAIVHLSSIRQSCMLSPVFGAHKASVWGAQDKLSPLNVLDNASSFYLNNWHSKYAYQTIY